MRILSIIAKLVLGVCLLSPALALAQSNACRALFSQSPNAAPEAAFLHLLDQIRLGKGTKDTLSPEEIEAARKIINEFQYYREMNADVRSAAEDLIMKVIFQSPDLEMTYSLINNLGLRNKFFNSTDLGENGPRANTLTWWLSKNPLATRPLGITGRTAAELGLSIVAHNTHSIAAVESITRPQNGRPNVFISRFAYPGETAMHGEGFYVKIGTSGAGGSGFTVKFEMEPLAREGSDFKIIGGEYLVIFNRSALRVKTN